MVFFVSYVSFFLCVENVSGHLTFCVFTKIHRNIWDTCVCWLVFVNLTPTGDAQGENLN